MKPISIGFEESLLKEINEKAKVLKMTRAELIRNAILEYLFKFDEVLDAKMLAEAIEKDEQKRPLEKIARELGFH
ncbi:MAG: ribbon-helix-helix protein, CopG family [Deltaproteobacteria bacterium]|nr:ribbon-helix-helix protein, CopG family [Deltaproteobacteria bacterium]